MAGNVFAKFCGGLVNYLWNTVGMSVAHAIYFGWRVNYQNSVGKIFVVFFENFYRITQAFSISSCQKFGDRIVQIGSLTYFHFTFRDSRGSNPYQRFNKSVVRMHAHGDFADGKVAEQIILSAQAEKILLT